MADTVGITEEVLQYDVAERKSRVSIPAVRRTQIDVHSYLDAEVDSLVLSVSRIIPYQDGHCISHPATWWDAFKLRWFPQWLLDLVGYEEITYEARAYLPDFDVSAWRKSGYEGLVAYRFAEVDE